MVHTITRTLCLYRIVHGSRVCANAAGDTGNVRFRTLDFSRDTSGYATQLLTLRPEPCTAFMYVTMDPIKRLDYQSFLLCNRSDLDDFFCKALCGTFPRLLLDLRKQRLQPDFRHPGWSVECTRWSFSALAVHVSPPLQQLPKKRRILSRQMVPLWRVPQPLPAPLINAKAGPLLHIVLASPSLRNALFSTNWECTPFKAFTDIALHLFMGTQLNKMDVTTAATAVKPLLQAPMSLSYLRKPLSRTLACLVRGLTSFCGPALQYFQNEELHHYISITHPLPSSSAPIQAFLQPYMLRPISLAAGLLLVNTQPIGIRVRPDCAVTVIGSDHLHVLSLSAVWTVEQDVDITYTRAYNTNGDPTWFSCQKSGVQPIPEIPLCHPVVIYYEREDNDRAPYSETPPPSQPPAFPTPVQPQRDTASSSSSSQSSSDTELMSDDEPDLHPTFMDTESDSDVEEFLEIPIPYQEDAMEYFSRSSGHTAANLSIILCTIGELTVGKPYSSWLSDFVSLFTSTLPVHVHASDFIEGYLFVHHFPFIDNDSICLPGCMPLSHYKKPPKSTVALKRYIVEALTDAAGTRPYDESWLAFAFSAVLSSTLDVDKRLPTVKRGLPSQESVGAQALQDFGEHILPNVLYDQQKANIFTEELCAAIKTFGLPSYFHTQTANMRFFPGLREAYAAITLRGLQVQHCFVLLTRIWHRHHIPYTYLCLPRTKNLPPRPTMLTISCFHTPLPTSIAMTHLPHRDHHPPAVHIHRRSVDLYINWIRHGREKAMGEVTHVWCRHEFQPDVGNLSHLHMIVWNKDILADGSRCVKTSLNRITASIQHAFDYVNDVDDRERLTALAWQYQQHRCTPKCKTHDGTCRYKCPFELQDEASYVNFPATCPENILPLLLDTGLCSISPTGQHTLHPVLQGGKYNPSRAHGNSRTSAFLALNFQATMSHSNTQVAGYEFDITHTPVACHLLRPHLVAYHTHPPTTTAFPLSPFIEILPYHPV